MLSLSCSDPEDKQIAWELRALKALIKEEKAVSGKVFKGAFGAAPKPRPNGADNSSSSGAGMPAAAEGGAANAEISEAAADDAPPSKRQAAGAGQGKDKMLFVQPLMALAVILIALVVFMLYGMPGVSR